MLVRRSRPARSVPLTLWLLLILVAGPVPGQPADDNPATPPQVPEAAEPEAPEPLVLDDPPEPLVPNQPRTEAEQNRMEALSLFATGRMLQWRNDDAGALRYYQRALRHDPDAETIAWAIVPVAIKLKREDEAIRYALKVEDPQKTDPLTLRQLGVLLTKKGDWPGAVALYEKALAGRKRDKESAADVLLRMEMGRLYHLVDEYGKAAENFARVLQAVENPEQFQLDEVAKKVLLGDPGSTYVLIGECFLKADRTDEAVAAFKESHQVEPNEALLGYNLARVDAQTGKPDKALEKLQPYFDQHVHSEGTAPYRLLETVLEDLQKQDELVGRLETLHADDPENVPLAYYLAEKHRKAGQLDKAEPIYLALSEKTPTLTGYRSLVEIYRKTKRPEALLDLLGKAAADNVGLENLGDEGRAVLEDPELVRTLIEHARKQHQDDPDQFGPDLRTAVTTLAMEAKQFDAAGEFFDLAIQSEPDREAELLLVWGLGLLFEEKYAEAAGVFQRGIDRKAMPEDNPVFHYYLAGALEMDGRTDEALAAARKAAEVKDDSARFLSRVAWILYHSDRHEEAFKVYTELVDRFGSDYSSAEVRQVLRETRLVLSNLCVLKDEMPQAEEWLQQVLDEFPDDVSALNDLGYIWADRNKHLQRAHRMIRKAVDEDPQNAAYRDSLGWVFYRLGRAEEAVAELEKAAAEEPDAVILDHLGDAYLAAGHPQKAKQAWQRAVDALREKGEAEEADKVQEKIDQETP